MLSSSICYKSLYHNIYFFHEQWILYTSKFLLMLLAFISVLLLLTFLFGSTTTPTHVCQYSSTLFLFVLCYYYDLDLFTLPSCLRHRSLFHWQPSSLSLEAHQQKLPQLVDTDETISD